MPDPQTLSPRNRLQYATSPYLLQHAHQPVDWYEWGPEALDKARDEDKPIFLSIGYSACHWCHVMAHETFDDPDVAALMNDYFVNVKVDREERPDLDELYMRATVMYTRGQGGWPMSVWLTPAGQPFAAGTYFPPTERYGRPSFAQVCRAVNEAWTQRRGDVTEAALNITQAVVDSLSKRVGEPAAPTATDVPRIAVQIADAFDARHGGLLSGATNKFPPMLAIDLLLRVAARLRGTSTHEQLLLAVTTSLDAMAAGGIRDHLAGGFARYSTDPQWHIPHFEKMLYDQALIARGYVEAHVFTGDPEYAAVARETCDYVLDDLCAPEGGFYSARDADSEGEEGRFYVWTREQIDEALGPDDAALFCDHYDVRPRGNWQDPHHPDAGPRNVLRIVNTLAETARRHDLSPEEAGRRLADARRRLRDIRARRVAPMRDEKILCEWNGLMIATLARAGAALGEPRYISAADRAADFILGLQQPGGRLCRSWRDGRTLEMAFLPDYANLCEGLLELFEVTHETRWLAKAIDLTETTLTSFWDEDGGGFYFTADDHEELLTRTKEVYDGVTPSGNSTQLLNLLRLATITGEERWHKYAERLLVTFGAEVRQRGGAAERFLAGADWAVHGPLEVVILGPRPQAETDALLETAWRTYVPSRVVLWHDPQAPSTLPAFAGRDMVDGVPTAYVCRGGTCQLPVTTPEALAEQLQQGSLPEQRSNAP